MRCCNTRRHTLRARLAVAAVDATMPVAVSIADATGNHLRAWLSRVTPAVH